ncbi:FAD-dependent oxidoreductase [Hyphomicrobiales bacterium 4NK60-0047b]
MQNSNTLWSNVTKTRVPHASLKNEHQANIAIIGGGFTGLSTALHLLDGEQSVTLIEAAEIGFGASGRNSGQVIPTMSGTEPDVIIKKHGEAGVRFAKLIASSAHYLFDLVKRENIACEAEQNGWFQPAHTSGRLSLSRKRVESWSKLGGKVSLLNAKSSAELIGSDQWHGGLLCHSGGHINPLALVHGLAEKVTQRGCQIFENTPALTLNKVKSKWHIKTTEGFIVADKVLLATNAYTDQFEQNLHPKQSRSIIPVTTYQMATEPLDKNLRKTILPQNHAVSDTRGDLRFFRWDKRNRLITGGALIYQASAETRLKKIIGERLNQTFHKLGTPKFDYIWSGRIGMTADRIPRFYSPEPGLWSWTACNGRGIALSITLGNVFAKALTGTPINELAIPITPIRPYPLHAIGKEVAPKLLAYYRWRDNREVA